MTSVGIAPSFTDSPYLPPEPEYVTQDKFQESQIKRERLTATILNIKENAQYEKRELLTGQQYFSKLQGGAIVTSYTFRLSFDLVSLNGGSIPNGMTTSISLPTDPTVNVPICITYVNGLIPVHGFGAGTNGTTYYFVNDPLLYVTFTNTSKTVQSVNVTNNTGGDVTQLYWVFEYIKF